MSSELVNIYPKKLEDCPRLKFWRMHDLRMERLEYAIEEGEDYEDDVTEGDILPDLNDYGGPQGYLYMLVKTVIHFRTLKRKKYHLDRFTYWHDVLILDDVAKDFRFSIDQLKLIYEAYPNQKQWENGDLHEMYCQILDASKGNPNE